MIFQKHNCSAFRVFRRSGAVFFTLGFLVVSSVSGQLQWENTRIDQNLSLGQEEAEAVFGFENGGAYPVVIRSTSSSCGCTTAELGQKIYQPGESGEIKTKFAVGGRTGKRQNTVQVQTDDPATPATTLIFAVDIPSLVTITPRLVQWRQGSEPETKTIIVQLNPDADLEITDVKVDNEIFQAIVKEGDVPGEYHLDLSPRHTNSPARAVFSLQTEPEVKNQQNFSFYAFVR